MGDVSTKMWDFTLLFSVMRFTITFVVLKLQNFDEKYWEVLNQINLDFSPFLHLFLHHKSQYSYILLFIFSSSNQENAKKICHFPVHCHLISNIIRRKHLHLRWQQPFSNLPAERQVRDKLLTWDVFGGSCAPQTVFPSTYLWLLMRPRSWSRTV